ncbi:Ig-like domain-containing protein [Exiguobacterium flavidum]|uniref:Ig-like domain-containing protein n=1 Tax=Exiguobacterium flavidum TaxID=2184695 RepID=UPI0018E59D2F|nr:Ig-like domain-containing protein [Exiguobacterium flavidum]
MRRMAALLVSGALVLGGFQYSASAEQPFRTSVTGKASDIPLVKPAGVAARLVDSRSALQTVTLQSVKRGSKATEVILAYASDRSANKDRYLGIEFYRYARGAFKLVGTTRVDSLGVRERSYRKTISNADFANHELYVRVGVFARNTDGSYTRSAVFKLRNGTPAVPAGNRYTIITNTSTDGERKQPLGMNVLSESRQKPYKRDINFRLGQALLQKRTAAGFRKQSFSPPKPGSSRIFTVMNIKTNTFSSIEPVLRYSGRKANVWVDQNQVTPEQAEKIGHEFDDRIEPAVTTHFGQSSDIDRDGKTNILLYDIQDGFAGSGGYVAGYFWPGDLIPNLEGSNRGEVFYIDTYPAMGMLTKRDVTSAYSTLAHEFQHMVNFNENVFKEQGSEMSLWLDEALAMAAEQVYTGRPLDERINYYNTSDAITSGHSLLYWDGGNDTLSNYALSYLFGQYIRGQAGGMAGLYGEIIGRPENDYRAVEAVLAKRTGRTIPFGDIMANFRAALFLNGKAGRYSFNGTLFNEALTQKIHRGTTASLRGGGAVVVQSTEPIKQMNGALDYRTFDIDPPAQPVAARVTTRTVRVTGKAEAGTVVRLYRSGRLLGKATASRDGTYSIPIAKQKKATRLVLYAVDDAKQESERRVIAVR